MASGGSKKSKKAGRQVKSPQNLRYKAERRHAKSHVRRLVKHLEKDPADVKAKIALEKYKIEAGTFKL